MMEFQPYMMFGGGWTFDSAKRLAGWKAKASKSGRVWVIGRAGKPGALSVMMLSGALDVAVYDEETGPDIYKKIQGGEPVYADAYHREELPVSCGWFLRYIDEDGNLRV